MKIKFAVVFATVVCLLASSAFAVENADSSAPTIVSTPAPAPKTHTSVVGDSVYTTSSIPVSGIGQIILPISTMAPGGKVVVLEPPPKKSVPFKMGMVFDVATPSGFSLGIEARAPSLPWFKFSFAGTGTLNAGIRGGLLFDPIKFFVAPVATVEVGHQFPFSIPGIKNSPDVEFSYANFLGGLGLGNRDGFRFLLMAGGSYIGGTANNFQALVGSSQPELVVGNPSFNGWVPAVKLGFSLLF